MSAPRRAAEENAAAFSSCARSAAVRNIEPVALEDVKSHTVNEAASMEDVKAAPEEAPTEGAKLVAVSTQAMSDAARTMPVRPRRRRGSASVAEKNLQVGCKTCKHARFTLRQ